MLFIYIFLVLFGALPMVIVGRRMLKAAKIKKEGVHTNGIIQHINSIRLPRGASMDIIRIEYKDRATGKSYNAKATTTVGKFAIGDTMEVIYLPTHPAKYAIDSKGGNTGMLIFSIILFLFVVFATYKIREMVQTGQM
ncbi:hypothetical protein CAP36_14125 [Chitinophagaceae bacterium IBVUCB2]|nr:hypothetical protein CAP36_14125 [Chitinophagaceae bacterium IBVUCB2]